MRPIVVFSVVVCGFGLVAEPQARGQVYGFSTPVGVPGGSGSADGTNGVARFADPGGVAVDASGNYFVADTGNHVVRKITRSGGNWIVTTIAGSAGLAGSVDDTNNAARFNNPYGIAADVAGNLYVADTYNHTIRKLTLYGTNWAVTTLAGLAHASGSMDGSGSGARFNYPGGITADTNGNVFVADSYNHSIRQVATATGVVTTPAGLAGAVGISDGTNSAARFQYPYGVTAVGSNVFVADTYNHTIRRLSPVTTDWVVSTIAGLPTFYGSDDGTNRRALFNYPFGIAADSSGNLFIADTYNHTVRGLAPAGTNWVSSTLGGSAGNPGSNDGSGQSALFNFPRGVVVNAAGSLLVADTANQAIRFGRFGFVLQSLLAGGQMVLWWPSQATNYVLETSGSLAPGAVWNGLSAGNVLSGTNFVRTNTVGAGPAFFRLRKN